METRKKLEEARFFLEKFRKSLNSEKQFIYYLSAFLSAWRSVLDVMLYDFAEYYSLGLTREHRMTDRDFFIVATAERNDQALRFLKWWEQRRQRLSKNKLWKMRGIIIHRGYPKIVHELYFPQSTAVCATAFTITLPKKADPLGSYITDGNIVMVEYTTLPKECQNAFKIMEKIILDAESKFSVG